MDDPASVSVGVAQPARFLARANALGVDAATLALANAALLILASKAAAVAEGLRGGALSGAADVVAGCALTGIAALDVGYFVALHAAGGQTLGKALCGIAVRSRSGEPIGLARSAVRWLGYLASALPFGMGFAIAALPPGRALHDHLAGTMVVRVPESES